MLALEALTGRRIGPSWELVRPLARGGMSALYVGRHAVTQREVAVKVLDPRAFTDPIARDRFVREVTAPARIRHPGIVEILDAGTDEALGAHFVVMELLEGHELRRELEPGPMAPERALALVDALLDPLAAAHKAGLVHRDLKPENVFLAASAEGTWRVKLLDFGIARDLSAVSATATATTFGTPHYMAPEQIQSTRSVSPAADVWAVGAMLHEMLAGQTPFQGETIPAVFIAVATQPTPELPESVPPAIRSLVSRCLDKDPRGRPPDAAALREALRAAVEGRAAQPLARVASAGRQPLPQQPPRASAPADAVPASHTATPLATRSPSQRARVPGWVAGALLGALLIVSAIVGVALLGRTEPIGAAPTTTTRDATRSAGTPAIATAATPSLPSGLEPPPDLTTGARSTATPEPSSATSGASVARAASTRTRRAVAAAERTPTAAATPPTPTDSSEAVAPTADPATATSSDDPSLPEAPSRAEVADALERIAPAVLACGIIAHGTATVALSVAGSTGRVTEVHVDGAFGRNPQLASCVTRAVRRATFPRFRRTTFTVSYPIRI